MTAKKLEEIRTLIEEKDALISLFGMEIIECRAGYAAVRMTVDDKALNALGACHGGALFSLADVAFALAANSHGTPAVALDMSISFIKAVPPGETITAECREKHRGRSIGSYIIELTDKSGQLVALLKATAFRKNR